MTTIMRLVVVGTALNLHRFSISCRPRLGVHHAAHFPLSVLTYDYAREINQSTTTPLCDESLLALGAKFIQGGPRLKLSFPPINGLLMIQQMSTTTTDCCKSGVFAPLRTQISHGRSSISVRQLIIKMPSQNNDITRLMGIFDGSGYVSSDRSGKCPLAVHPCV